MSADKSFKTEQIFHITLKERRTSFSLDNYLSELLAVKLGYEPHSRNAHSAIRTYLTNTLNESNFDPLIPISRQARRKAIKAIADPALVAKHVEWWINDE